MQLVALLGWDYDSPNILFPGKEMRGRMYLVTWTLMGSRRHHWMGCSGIRVSVPQLKLVMDLANMFGALGTPWGPAPGLDELCHF